MRYDLGMKSLGISMKWAGMIGLVVMTMGGCESKPAATDSPPVAVSKAVPAVSAEVVSQGFFTGVLCVRR